MDGRMKEGEDAPNCLANTVLKVKDEHLDYIDMSTMASALMIGGVETTASIMQWSMALNPAYPHVQTRAQELDPGAGHDRPPTLADEINLLKSLRFDLWERVVRLP
jgi:cytochrome P450